MSGDDTQTFKCPVPRHRPFSELSVQLHRSAIRHRTSNCVSNPRAGRLGTLIELRKAIIISVMSVCPSVRSSVHAEKLGSQWTNFHKIFRKSVENIPFYLKSDKNNVRILYIDQYTCSIISRSFLLRMRNSSDKTHR